IENLAGQLTLAVVQEDTKILQPTLIRVTRQQIADGCVDLGEHITNKSENFKLRHSLTSPSLGFSLTISQAIARRLQHVWPWQRKTPPRPQTKQSRKRKASVGWPA